jgi:hypothetical protein
MRTMKRLALALLEYLLGFLALAVFAAVAFSVGAPTDERLIGAFKLGAVLAAVELAVLWARTAPANRLIVGANAWLLAGGLAAFTEQWWWLKGYQHLGETSLFLSMVGGGHHCHRVHTHRLCGDGRTPAQSGSGVAGHAAGGGVGSDGVGAVPRRRQMGCGCFRSSPCPGSIAWRRRP